MQQDLEFPGCLSLVSDQNARLQAISAQSDAVNEAEVVWPGLLRLIGEVRGRQTEIETHAAVAVGSARCRLRSRLSEEFPARCACEAVLRELGCRSVRRCGAKDLLFVTCQLCRIMTSIFPSTKSTVSLPPSACNAERLPKSQEKPSSSLTGNTKGMPPLTALLPSKTAASLSHSFSAPFVSFQLTIVAPYSRISTLSPVGRRAFTRPLSELMSTIGWGARPGVVARAAGFFGRSTMAAVGYWELAVDVVG